MSESTVPNFLTADSKAIDFDKMMEHIKATYKVDYRDVLGRDTPKRQRKADKLKKEWAFANGFGESWTRIYSKREPCNAGDPLYEEYIRIEQGWFADGGEKFLTEIPYMDVWHWLIDNDFNGIYDFPRGETPTIIMDLTEARILTLPQHVAVVFALIHREVAAHTGFNPAEVPFRIKC